MKIIDQNIDQSVIINWEEKLNQFNKECEELYF